MRKSKGEQIELLYNTEPEKKIKTKRSNKKINKKSVKGKKNISPNKSENEIVIGLSPKENNVQKKKRTNKNSKSKKTKKTRQKKIKNPIKLKIIKWTSIFIFAILAIILFMLSDVFNIKEIVVINNNKVDTETVKYISGLDKNQNMFKTRKREITKRIKTNPYIESVEIKRTLNGTVTIDVKERIPTYMIQKESAYVYVNNQGYVLEISNEPIQIPIITGYNTDIETLETGSRLKKEDLEKLDGIIKVMEVAKNKELSNIITSVDIVDKNNYKFTLQSEGKTILLGELANINEKLDLIKELLQREKGKSGEIIIESAKRAYFREQII